MSKCEHCGREILSEEERTIRGREENWRHYQYWDYCDGILTLGPDPFAEEIHDDHTEYEMCEGQRQDSAWDI